MITQHATVKWSVKLKLANIFSNFKLKYYAAACLCILQKVATRKRGNRVNEDNFAAIVAFK